MKLNKEAIADYEAKLDEIRLGLKATKDVLNVTVGVVYPSESVEVGEIGLLIDVSINSYSDTEISTFFEEKFPDVQYEIRRMGEGNLQLQGGDHCGFSSTNDVPPSAIVFARSHGTIGACFEAETDDDPYTTKRFLLTCSHVVYPNGFTIGDVNNIRVCTDPGGAVIGSNIATLRAYTDATGSIVNVDAAIAELNENSGAEERAIRNLYWPNSGGPTGYETVERITDAGRVETDRDDLIGVNVIMRGCASQTQYGVIEAVDYDATIGQQRYPRQLVIRQRKSRSNMFSQSGDSGSLVIEEATRKPIGLLVGGRTYYRNGVRCYESYANYIQTVLSALGLRKM